MWLWMLVCAPVIIAQNEQQASDTKMAVQAMCDAAAPKLRQSGTNEVVLMMTVDDKGRVRSFKTESPKGVQLEKMKDTAAAIKKIMFGPARKDGSPVPAQIRIAFKCAAPQAVDSKK